MSRPIRNERARSLQGRRAGIFSRALAGALDVTVAFGIYVALISGVGLVWDLFFSDRVTIPNPGPWFTIGATWAILVLYLATGWGATGRTLGKQLMGLRVVGADAQWLTPRRAFRRALWCATFPIGLAWALLHPRNAAVHDLTVGTVVVYDWIPEVAQPRTLGARSGEARP